MVAAVDPTFPLYSIACLTSSAMLLLVFLTSFVRQSWNLGVAFLCFWVFWENLAGGIDAIIWANNTDTKLYVYCDIVSRLGIISAVVRPMSTLIITRRLWMITSTRSVALSNEAARRRNLVMEWMLGLLVPLIIAGPLYYTVQQLRFEVLEGWGCGNSSDNSILGILLLESWSITLPLISVAVYYPRMAKVFCHQSREVNRFLDSNDTVSRTNYYRILALASIDVLLTLLLGIATTALNITQTLSVGTIPFYFGWTYDHTDWAPEGFSYTDLVAQGTSTVAQQYFTHWTSPILAFAIFGLFGVTSEAWASYLRVFCIVGGWLVGSRSSVRVHH